MPSACFSRSGRAPGARRLRGLAGAVAIGAFLAAGCGANALDGGSSDGGNPDAGDDASSGSGDGSGGSDAGRMGLADGSMNGAGMDGGNTDRRDAATGGDAGIDQDAARTGDAGTAPDGSSDSASGGKDASAVSDGGSPGVRIVGRTAPGTVGTRFEWPGVSIAARFSGTQVSIQLNDGNNQNEFYVIVDGGPPSTLVTTSGQTTYSLATGLANGTHDLLVWRRTEAFYNPTEFLGLSNFGVGGALLAPPPAPNRRIEIIGDSISCGYGIEGTPGCTGSATNENNYLAYGSVAARALGADVVTIAWSGIGMYRNYNELVPSTPTMPARYDFAIPTDASTTWDFAKYQPQAVVINLGSNDFSTHGDPGQPYVDAYVNFVRHVRSKYSNTYIFCVIQWPPSGADINQAVTTLTAAGETKIESFDINVSTGAFGCEGHPDVAKSNAMGIRLATEMQRVLGW